MVGEGKLFLETALIYNVRLNLLDLSEVPKAKLQFLKRSLLPFFTSVLMPSILISGVTLTLWSNPLNKELCPVTALIAWLLVAGL